jgi:hypothetical protein
MRTPAALIAVSAALLLGACASEEKEWMKIDSKFTMKEFQRDYAACSKGGKLNETCMQNRGWIAVSPGTNLEKAPPPPALPSQPSGITSR